MNGKRAKLNVDATTGLNAVKAWLRYLSSTERAAVFGAIEDEWCIQCGKKGHAGPCNVPQRKTAQVSNSLEG